MFTSKQYRAKATEYGDLAETSAGSNQRRDFQTLNTLKSGTLPDGTPLLEEGGKPVSGPRETRWIR